MTINFKTKLNLVIVKVILYNDMIFLGRKKYNQAKMLIMCIFSDYRATKPVVTQRPAVQHQLACVYLGHAAPIYPQPAGRVDGTGQQPTGRRAEILPQSRQSFILCPGRNNRP